MYKSLKKDSSRSSRAPLHNPLTRDMTVKAGATAGGHHSTAAARQKPATRHERRLTLCARDLAAHIAAGEGIEDIETFFASDLESWLRMNTAQASRYAGSFIDSYIDAHTGNASLGHTVRLYVHIFAGWGVIVPADIRGKLQLLESSERLHRKDRLREQHEAQIKALGGKWEAMVHYMSTTDPGTFRDDLRAGSEAGDAGGVAKSTLKEMVILANKGDDELRTAMVRTRAFVSLLRATGMRPGSAVLLERENFSCTVDGGVLVRRTECKTGSGARVERYVCIVPGADQRLDPLLHIAEHLHGMRCDDRFIFASGFELRKHDNKSIVSFELMVQRRYTAILNAVAMAVGLPNGLGVKQLHAFRIMCTNALFRKGAFAGEVDTHIGRGTSSLDNDIASPMRRALNARTPYLLAGRATRGTPAHPLWALHTQRGCAVDANDWFDDAMSVVRAAGIVCDSNSEVVRDCVDDGKVVASKRKREAQSEGARARKLARRI